MSQQFLVQPGINTIKLFLPYFDALCGMLGEFSSGNICAGYKGLRTLSYWGWKFTDANPFSAQNNASKITVFFTTVVFRPNWVYSIGPWSSLRSRPNFARCRLNWFDPWRPSTSGSCCTRTGARWRPWTRTWSRGANPSQRKRKPVKVEHEATCIEPYQLRGCHINHCAVYVKKLIWIPRPLIP